MHITDPPPIQRYNRIINSKSLEKGTPGGPRDGMSQVLTDPYLAAPWLFLHHARSRWKDHHERLAIKIS
jgi:hypothetical protein